MKRMIVLTMALMMTAAMVCAQPAQGKKSKPQPAEQEQAAPAKKGPGKKQLMGQAKLYVQTFNLAGEDSAKFVNTFQAYNKQLRAIRLQYKPEKPAEGKELTEEQVEKRIINSFEQSRAILDTREQFYKEFRKILSPKQINRIFKDEQARRAKQQVRKPAPGAQNAPGAQKAPGAKNAPGDNQPTPAAKQ